MLLLTKQQQQKGMHAAIHKGMCRGFGWAVSHCRIIAALLGAAGRKAAAATV